MIVTLLLFCASSNGNASKPGAANRQVQLRAVKAAPPTPAVPATATSPAVAAVTPMGPNDSLFDNAQAGDVNVSFNQVNAATKAFFDEGGEYLVTIEKVPAATA